MSDGDSLKVTESGQDCTWKVADLKWICSPAAEMDRKTVCVCVCGEVFIL